MAALENSDARRASFQAKEKPDTSIAVGSTLMLPSTARSRYRVAVTRIRIAAAEDIVEGTTIPFPFMRANRPQEGFAGRFQGKLFAYENTCRHIPITLDYGDNRFFDSTGKTLMCQTHGAVYEPDTGLCVRGPCAGASLFALEIMEENGAIWFMGAPEKKLD